MISSKVCILTKDELEDLKNKAFQRGVERGKFEAHMADALPVWTTMDVVIGVVSIESGVPLKDVIAEIMKQNEKVPF